MKKYVISTPHTSVTPITDKDTHLVVACDGIFDVMEDQFIADKLLDEKYAELDAAKLSHLLVALALQKESGDNLVGFCNENATATKKTIISPFLFVIFVYKCIA